jgi:hypothetical protein
VSKSSFVPYLEGIHFRQSYKEPLLFGLSFDADVATLERHLGAPAGVREEAPGRPYWLVAIDQGRGLQFTADYYDGSPQMSLTIDEARELNNAGHSKPSVGLFVAWAIERGVLDPNRFGAWLPLIAKVKAREIQGSAFYDAALPRGLWDRHLVNRPGLRDFAFGWFHNIGVGGKYITSELIKVFGKYRHPHDYDEPNLTEDTWANVDRASPHARPDLREVAEVAGETERTER